MTTIRDNAETADSMTKSQKHHLRNAMARSAAQATRARRVAKHHERNDTAAFLARLARDVRVAAHRERNRAARIAAEMEGSMDLLAEIMLQAAGFAPEAANDDEDLAIAA